MSVENNIWKQAEGYVLGTLSEAERNELLVHLQAAPEFAAEFQECVDLLRSLKDSGKQDNFRKVLKDVRVKEPQKSLPAKRTIPLRTYYWRTAAVAAGIALLTSFTTYWAINRPDKRNASQYSVLRREIENIKRSQNQLIKNIKDKNNTPVAPVKYTGTGFALSNDGYLVTNYHVIDGADSVYIQNRTGNYYKAYVKAFDPKNDIAILKVQDHHFRFSKTGDVPYTFSNNKAGLGARVYTLGFPDEQVMYNEGYVSAKNGFQEDSMQYCLELPADPGQSGAPVLDNKGNVLGIVTARNNQEEGNTYAVSTKALLQLLQSLPKDESLHLPKVNRLHRLDREAQIKKLEYYTCVVKVYKK